MMNKPLTTKQPSKAALTPFSICLIAALSACGGGADNPTADAGAAPASVMLAATSSAAALQAQPAFHRMPTSLPEPSDVDRDGRSMSAYHAPDIVLTPPEFSGLSSKGLTDEQRDQFLAELPTQAKVPGSGGTATPAATNSSSVVYTPAQIRAAYNFATLSGAAPATLGAGQTIYIVDAYNHPNVVKDLNAFSAKFGLPSCTQVAVSASSSSLPLASQSACQIAVLYSTASGGMTSKAPAYNAGWAQEIALDTQWAHAIAPLARIVLIEAASNSLSDLGGSIMLANKFGSGAVSMSFSSPEGSWVNQSNYSGALFTTGNVSYFAATGDSGTAVNWPAVIPSVVGVGGTSLNYTGATRSEKTWSGTGGGISAYVPKPSYQTGLNIAGQPISTANFRAAGDVSMDADPYTGVYVAFTSPTARQTSWYAFGGTSLATPMWAAAVTVANASRAANHYSSLGAPHALLYATLAAGGSYLSDFYDISTGSNGSCGSCYAVNYYDAPTGLGTPLGSSLLPYLANTP